jgi:hypothetical protein
MTEVRFRGVSNVGVFKDWILKEVRRIAEDEYIEAAKELQQGSPVGATGDLKAGWDVLPARRVAFSSDIGIVIVNRADNAIYRLRGRGPGKFPPFGDGIDLSRWAKLKRISPYVVARKIAREGTERWKSDGKNWAGIRRDGSLTAESPISKANTRIKRRLDGLRSPF